ncbi:DinB family protein [Cohnella nanjingensis]|uniref:DinB family protein n=2 Tax=Cohnella nanjingensis TaxID=1387779 RepID=A0A7X0RSP3_9BACL|nr:DinB family protein [Cohnella nanjingensis]
MIHHYLPKLTTSLQSLDERTLRLKESADLNSILGIAKHMLEHIRRNTQRYRDPNVQFEQGIENTFPEGECNKETLLKEVEETFQAFDEALCVCQTVEMYDLYHLVEHTGYHLGQIIDRAQRLTGARYRFMQSGISETALKAWIVGD